MNRMERGAALTGALLLAGAVLAGCSTTGDEAIAANDQPSQITAPVNDSAVSSNSLPPIGGSDGSVQVADNNGSTAPPSPPLIGDNAADAGITTGAAAPPSATGAAPGSFVSLNDVGKTAPTGAGRNLAGGLTVEKLIGGWTVTAGSSQCRLNLTYTAASSDGHYRASAPGCQIATLGGVSSWQLSGTQVQLFDATDKLVGALLLSGNRFIGTLSGGQAITMVG
jgi:protease inhibitor Inh